jgi:hypothetical protein
MTHQEQLDTIKDAWREAAMQDVPQVTQRDSARIVGDDLDAAPSPVMPRLLSRGVGDVGYCATGWLVAQYVWEGYTVLDLPVTSCPVCGLEQPFWRDLSDLIIHYNDYHGYTWLDLANKVELPGA